MQVSKFFQVDTLTSKNSIDSKKTAGPNDFAAIFSSMQVEEKISQTLVTSTSSSLKLDTSHGKKTINIEDYFNPQSGVVSLEDTPLLLPSPMNIEALAKHASNKFQKLLEEYNIPKAPSRITFDQYGKMQLPNDYSYSEELKQFFTENPILERQLSTINALTSHFVGMQESIKFNEEYSKAKTQMEVDLILKKYSYLFNSSQQSSNIALLFSADGEMSITADGKPYRS